MRIRTPSPWQYKPVWERSQIFIGMRRRAAVYPPIATGSQRCCSEADTCPHILQIYFGSRTMGFNLSRSRLQGQHVRAHILSPWFGSWGIFFSFMGCIDIETLIVLSHLNLISFFYIICLYPLAWKADCECTFSVFYNFSSHFDIGDQLKYINSSKMCTESTYVHTMW